MRYFKDENNSINAINDNQEHLIKSSWTEIKECDILGILRKNADLNQVKEHRINAIKIDFENAYKNSLISVKGVGVVNGGDSAINSINELLSIIKDDEELDFLLADNKTTITANKKILESIKKALILDKIKLRKKKWALRDKAQNAKNIDELDATHYIF